MKDVFDKVRTVLLFSSSAETVDKKGGCRPIPGLCEGSSCDLSSGSANKLPSPFDNVVMYNAEIDPPGDFLNC